MKSTPEWIPDAVSKSQGKLVETRRHLHSHPELSGQEVETAGYVAGRLASVGIEPQLVLGGTGVVAELAGTKVPASRHEQALLLRADIDALPILEAKDGRPSRSLDDGVMHACGHDVHTAILLSVAEALVEHRDQFAGRVCFVFQPSEERISGAAALINAGALEGRAIGGVLGLHVLSQMPAGSVGTRHGALYGSSDEFTLEVIGNPGHGGLPHKALDPIPVAAAVIQQTQTIASREVSPLEPVVVSFGTIHGGESTNGVADSVTLTGTVRSFDPELREWLLGRVADVAESVAAASRMSVRFSRGSGCPAVVSDPRMVHLVNSAVEACEGARLEAIGQLPVADDVAEFMNRWPGCYFMLGAGNESRGITAPHHHPNFDVDEDCLAIGMEVMLRATVDFCERGLGSDLSHAAPRVLRIDVSR